MKVFLSFNFFVLCLALNAYASSDNEIPGILSSQDRNELNKGIQHLRNELKKIPDQQCNGNQLPNDRINAGMNGLSGQQHKSNQALFNPTGARTRPSRDNQQPKVGYYDVRIKNFQKQQQNNDMPSSIGLKKNHNINGVDRNTGKPVSDSVAFMSDPCGGYGFGNGMQMYQGGGEGIAHDDRDSFPMTGVDQCSSDICTDTISGKASIGGEIKKIKAEASITIEIKKERICTPKEDRKKKEDPPKETPTKDGGKSALTLDPVYGDCDQDDSGQMIKQRKELCKKIMSFGNNPCERAENMLSLLKRTPHYINEDGEWCYGPNNVKNIFGLLGYSMPASSANDDWCYSSNKNRFR